MRGSSLPSLQLFLLCVGLGNQFGLEGNPLGPGEKDKGVLASSSITFTHRKSEIPSAEPHFSSSCGLMNIFEQKPTRLCPIALAHANSNLLAFFQTHFPSILPTQLPSPSPLTVFSRCNDQRVHRMAKAMVVWWVLAITSWLSDRWLCWLCQAINFPYFHSFW